MNRYGETKNNLSRSINDDVPEGAIHQILPTNFDMNRSSWTGFLITPEHIHNSFAIDEINLAIEKNEVTFYPTSGDRNEDVDELIECIDVINVRKFSLPINKIETSDEITSTTEKNDDHRDIISHFSHQVTSNNVCVQQPSSDFSSSINNKGKFEFGLALEGLQGITTALDRQLDFNR